MTHQAPEEKTHTATDDSFQLYDLRVEVICPPGERIMCGAKIGDYFTLEGEMLHLPPGQGFSIYSLGTDFHLSLRNWIERGVRLRAPHYTYLPFSSLIYTIGAVLPLLAAKQRVTHPNDWISTDAEIACPDPNCKSKLRIERIGLRTFRHADVTVVPLTSKLDA